MPLKSLELEEAISAFVSGSSVLPSEEVGLKNALGRVLAADVVSAMDQPPFPRSPLDGYAFIAGDSAGASKEAPAVLKVIDKVFAGHPAANPVTSGTAVRVMTGSMLPEGCNCVIRQEDTDYGEDVVNIYTPMRAFDNYCYSGEDFKTGDVLIPRGMTFGATAAAVAASAGVPKVGVPRRPRVSVISTGDELVSPGEALPAGKIYNSNLFYITSRLTELGAETVTAITAGDDKALITAELKKAAKVSDLVITTGGVSVGQKDLLPVVTEEIGARLVFHGVAMKPGSPVLYTVYEGTPILSLSGNPFAANVTFELFAREMLAVLMGNASLKIKRVSATLLSDFPKRSPGRRLVRGMFAEDSVRLPSGHSSGQIASMIGCNCLIDIPAGSPGLAFGDMVSVLLL